ncbi:PREDICTED: CBL-interacting serine/threonine-protein kinase 25-like [Erythranthe guttata]|uniref:CBL-interacting serine/threonine-protein kinase 25-like n=1 Tax=Erythranthe guttata TaxID=4155 RepID=UPI00064D9F1F|nr:PREDICTED: CBL-interacting serine/threonine-protein kinase 25-like [Erythranthe guttata]|eukprot:XP_012856161.1 PREDICTED: CBL-interacting serine/threonine-protein kinase 25-like [Erythranthe guttata]
MEEQPENHHAAGARSVIFGKYEIGRLLGKGPSRRCFLPFQHENIMKMYTKIFKAEFSCPPWFPFEAKKLISRILVTDPDKRITVPEITKLPWFRKGLPAQIPFSPPLHEDILRSKSSSPPPFYNAFEFISSMSSGFDLSGLFENRRKSSALFTSRCSAPAIVAKIESVAKKVNFRVLSSKDYYKVRLEGVSEGRKGKLAVTAEVFSFFAHPYREDKQMTGK